MADGISGPPGPHIVKEEEVKKDNKKIGYIYLPEFYADFENPNGPRCSRDVAIERVQEAKDHL